MTLRSDIAARNPALPPPRTTTRLMRSGVGSAVTVTWRSVSEPRGACRSHVPTPARGALIVFAKGNLAGAAQHAVPGHPATGTAGRRLILAKGPGPGEAHVVQASRLPLSH